MDLSTLLARYQAPPEAKQLIEATEPVELLGVTGAGKSALGDLLETIGGDFYRVVSHTTRQPRSNNGKPEQDGVDYHFVSKSYARSMFLAHNFVEAHFVHGEHLYGTTLDELRKAQTLGKRALMDIDIQGADDYHTLSDAGTALFLLPPDIEQWRARLLKRYGSEDELMKVLPTRFKTAHREITTALERDYLHMLANADLTKTALLAIRIMNGDPYDDASARDDAMTLVSEIETYLEKIGEPLDVLA